MYTFKLDSNDSLSSNYTSRSNGLYNFFATTAKKRALSIVTLEKEDNVTLARI